MIFVTLHGAWNLSIRDAQGVTKKVNNPVAEALAFEEGTFVIAQIQLVSQQTDKLDTFRSVCLYPRSLSCVAAL